MSRVAGEAVGGLCVCLFSFLASAATIPVDLGPEYQPAERKQLPRSDGVEILLSAPGGLVPDATTANHKIFTFDRNTGLVSVVSDLSGEVEGVYDFSGAGVPRASRDFRKVATEIGTRRHGEGGGGGAIWLKDRDDGTFTLVTRRPDGTLPQAIGFVSLLDGMDATGRFITFRSNAADLVPNDTNGRFDVFLFDAQTKQNSRLSVTSMHEEAALGADASAISPDGQYVAIQSTSALLPSDTNNVPDWYLLDRAQDSLKLISAAPTGHASSGVAGPGRWSDDGRYFWFSFAGVQTFKLDGTLASGVVYDRAADRMRSMTAVLGFAPDGVMGRGDAAVDQISPSGRYMLLQGKLLPPPYQYAYPYPGLFLADLQTQEVVRIDLLPSGAPPSGPNGAAWIVGDSPRVLFENSSPELGTGPRTLMHEWQPPLPGDIEVTVDGPRSSFASDAQPRYTVQITNRGDSTVNDLVYRRYFQLGQAGNNEGTTCATQCSLPPLGPGQTASFSFVVTPERTTDDPTLRIQFDVRAQSLGRFDRTPSNNKVVVNASASGSGNGGGGGGGGGGSSGSSGGGGGDAASLVACLLLISFAVRLRTMPRSRHRDRVDGRAR